MLGTPVPGAQGWGGDDRTRQWGWRDRGEGAPRVRPMTVALLRMGSHCLTTDTRKRLPTLFKACLFRLLLSEAAGSPGPQNTPSTLGSGAFHREATSQTPSRRALWHLLEAAGEVQRRGASLEGDFKKSCWGMSPLSSWCGAHPRCGACYDTSWASVLLLLLLLSLAALRMEDLSSQARDRSHVPALGAWNLNNWTTSPWACILQHPLN